MKKTLVAIAALTLVGAASAQVTITGNTSFSYQKDLTDAKGLSLSDNSIFFTVTEDLGGGLKLVAKTGVDVGGRAQVGGATAAQEDASLTVSGGFGAVKLMSYESDGPLANVEGLSGASLGTGIFDTNAVGLGKRFRNGISYAAPTMSGFTPAFTYVTLAGTYASTNSLSSNTKMVPALTYVNGPLKAYIEDAFFNADYAGTTNGVTNGGISQVTTYVTYDFGAAKVGAGWSKPTNGDAQIALGLSVPVGALTFGIATVTWKNSNDQASTATTAKSVGDATWTEASVAYSLSKRTSLKASFGTVNDAGLAYALPNASYGLTGGLITNSQTRLGIFHSF